jgi:hypothetical protein
MTVKVHGFSMGLKSFFNAELKRKRQMSKVVEVANTMANSVGVTVRDIMKKFKVSKPYAYNLMSQARKQFVNRRDEALAKPKARMARVQAVETVAVNADAINHPTHYKTGGIETIDFIEAKNLNYHLGNVVKYITRADHKGERLEDLKKAQWYLNREIENLSK